MHRASTDFPAYEPAPGRVECRLCGLHYPRYYVDAGDGCADCKIVGDGRLQPTVRPADSRPSLGDSVGRIASIRERNRPEFNRRLRHLSDRQRQVIPLILEGRQATGVARVLKISPQSAQTLVCRAVENFLVDNPR